MSENSIILRKYFNPAYYIVEESSPNNFNVAHVDQPYLYCLELRIDGDIMKVDYISKCNYRISGTQILNIISNFVKDVGIRSVKLKDKSELPGLCRNYNIPLYIIYILSTGKSWYNSYGYVSKKYDEEIVHNNKLLNMPMNEFVQLCNSKRRLWRQSEEEVNEMITGFFDVMNTLSYKKRKSNPRFYPSMSVQETFVQIKKYILKSLPEVRETDEDENIYCFMLKWLLELIHISGVIMYDFKLTWIVSRPYSGKTPSRRYSSTSYKRKSTDYKNNFIFRKKKSLSVTRKTY
jgi:hypothetical protein